MHRIEFGLAVILAAAVPSLVLLAAQLRYDREYPALEYSETTPTDPVAELGARLCSGEAELRFDPAHGQGYLASLLEELSIPVASQILVFTKTSFQKGLISPETPRAIYFNDDAYVAWVQKGPALEVSALDPVLGAVFYTLPQNPEATELTRETFTCLRCHDSYSLTGGGVPRYLMGSGVPDATGRLLSHEGWILTSDETPLEKRWGGWYVTGTHGDQRHLGNLYPDPGGGAKELDSEAGANVTDLSRFFDSKPYLGEHSDIVALLVIEHQVHVQNLTTRVGWDTRMALLESEAPDVAAIVEPLVRAMLFVDEAPLTDPVTGTSRFASEFVRRGPFDEDGRTLRELDLETRLFRYPLSYLVYSKSFDALPPVARRQVATRFNEVLTGADEGADFAHLSRDDGDAVLEILAATKPDFASLLESDGP